MTATELAQESLVALIGQLYGLLGAIRKYRTDPSDTNLLSLTTAVDLIDQDQIKSVAEKSDYLDPDTDRAVAVIQMYRSRKDVDEKDLGVIERAIVTTFKMAANSLPSS